MSQLCEVNGGAVKVIVPEALDTVSSASIRGFYRLVLRATDAHSAAVQYGTEELKQKMYHPRLNISSQGPKPEAKWPIPTV